jgi:GxxExxY protein
MKSLRNDAQRIEEINYVSRQVVDAAMRVHSVLGPGLLESAYEACLAQELRNRGLHVLVQVPLPLVYEGFRVEVGYRADLLVNDSVIVEVKAIARLLPIHDAQLLSHLRLSGHRVGLLINFHVVHLKDGIKRLVNKF